MIPFFLIVTIVLVTTVTALNDPLSWYKRYNVYHPYCSTPEEMDKRAIPPLTQDHRVGESRLVHATVIFRHGARTPYKGGMECWSGYQENPDTGVWNCSLTSFASSPPPDRVNQQEEDTATIPAVDAGAMFLFEKRYDALYNPLDNISNELNGTCQVGQLILQGYEQELHNGQHLRGAYVFGYDKNHDPRMRLLDVSSSKINAWSDIYLRADDDQRTTMSGQVVLRGLLQTEVEAYVAKHHRFPVVPLHTADRRRDILDANDDICPRLQELRERYEASRDFRVFNELKEVETLRNFQKNVLGSASENGDIDGGLDCLMTTMCSDRPLPSAIDDYRGGDEEGEADMQQPLNVTDYGTDIFLRLTNLFVRKAIGLVMANYSEYAKLAIGPLGAEILDNINAVIQKQPEVCCPFRSTPKLALFSGHDTTLISLLAALGMYDSKWPPYASMMAIEIHNINIDGQTNKQLSTTDYGFRIVYNGNVVTHLVTGCLPDAEICDVQVLIGHLSGFATREPDCQRQHPIPVVHADTVSRASELLSTKEGLGATILLILGSASFGAVGTYLYMSSWLRQRNPLRRRKYRAAPTEGDGIVSDLGNGDAVYSVTAAQASVDDEEDGVVDMRLT
jgi:hypothetical protein